VNDPEAPALIQPEGAFEPMRGTVPFQPDEHRRIAVKVIDFRGNELVKVVSLGGSEWAR
jgi:adenine-specific DNA-methyltransferase